MSAAAHIEHIEQAEPELEGAVRLHLSIDIPVNAVARDLKIALLSAGITGEGITITTSRGVHYDVDLVNVDDVSKEVLTQ